MMRVRTNQGRSGASSAMLCLALALATLVATALAQAPEMRDADWKTMQTIIAEQRAALIAGDGDKAFAYVAASDATRLLGSPERPDR